LRQCGPTFFGARIDKNAPAAAGNAYVNERAEMKD
jgi:hypothetical protein